MEIKREILNINISDIIPNQFQPRMKFDDNRINELANSIKKYGIINPLLLRLQNGKYEIIAGERRYKAAIMAGLQTIPAIIGNLTDAESAELALVENIQRQDLSSLEEAKSYQNLMMNENLSKEQISSTVSKNQAFIDNRLRLLELSLQTKDALLNNLISEGHARTLLKLNDKSKENEALNKIITERLTVKEADEYIKELNQNFSSLNTSSPTQDIVNLRDLSVPEQSQENVNQALENLNVVNENSIFNEPQIDIQRKENNMNNEMNLNGGLNSFSSPQPQDSKFFPSMEDQSVNMNAGQPSVATPPTFGVPTQPAMPSMEVPSFNVASPQPMTNNFNVPNLGGLPNVAPEAEPVMGNMPQSPVAPIESNFGLPNFGTAQPTLNGQNLNEPAPQPASFTPQFTSPSPVVNTTTMPISEPVQTAMPGPINQPNPALDNIKLLVAELQKNGFQIEIHESDTPTDFQLTINIKK